jgi:hypothetical protein
VPVTLIRIQGDNVSVTKRDGGCVSKVGQIEGSEPSRKLKRPKVAAFGKMDVQLAGGSGPAGGKVKVKDAPCSLSTQI